MPYEATTEQLIEDTQNYLDGDPRFFDADHGFFTWWGRVVEFIKHPDEITLRWDDEEVTFVRP